MADRGVDLKDLKSKGWRATHTDGSRENYVDSWQASQRQTTPQIDINDPKNKRREASIPSTPVVKGSDVKKTPIGTQVTNYSLNSSRVADSF